MFTRYCVHKIQCFPWKYLHVSESPKRSTIQSKIDDFAQKLIRSFLNLHPNRMSNLMSLAHGVLKIFSYESACWKRGIFQSNIYKTCSKVNQVSLLYIQTVCQISWAQVKEFLRYFVNKVFIIHYLFYYVSSHKRGIFINDKSNGQIKYGSTYFSCSFHVWNF